MNLFNSSSIRFQICIYDGMHKYEYLGLQKFYVICFPIMDIYKNIVCSNTNMSMFLFRISDTSYLRDFVIQNFRISYSSSKFISILNLLCVIFHRSLCKFGGNLVSKLGLILYIDVLSFKQQFLIDQYWRTITKNILAKICSDLAYLG